MKLLDSEHFTSGLPEVTSSQLFQMNGDKLSYHEDGLLSQQIFGYSENDRKKKFAYISLKGVEILHPILFDSLKMDKALSNIILNKSSYILKEDKLVKDPKGQTGFTFFKEIYDRYIPNSQKIKNTIETIKENPDKAFLRKLIVVPPGIRETGQELKFQTVTLVNEQYINVLRSTQRIPSDLSSRDDFDYYCSIIQTKANVLFNTLKGEVGTKMGLSRQHIQAKRVDFSGRAAISLDNNLSLDYCGLPIMIAIKIFEPFLIRDLMKLYKQSNNTLTTKSVINMLRDVYYNDVNSQYFEAVKDVLEAIMKKRLVLLNRAPSLHRYSIMAFHPVLNYGKTITISPFVCGPFNADFDGDQMAVYHPLTKESQEDAKKMLPSENIISSSSFDLNYNLSQNFAYFLYYATSKVSNKKAINISKVDLEAKIVDFSKKVKVNSKETTIGRYLVTKAIRDSDPSKTKNFPFIESSLTKKEANNLLKTIYFTYGKTALLNTLTNIKNLTIKYGSEIADVIPHFKLSPSGYKKVSSLVKKLEENPNNWKLIEIAIQKDVEKNNPLLAELINSKTTKLNWTKVAQALATKGYVTSFTGESSLIKHSQLDGMTPDELFKDSSNNRQGIIDRALSTRIPGYLLRQFIFALSPVKKSPTVKDCGTKRVLELEVTSNLKNQIIGRTMLLNQHLIEITPKIAEGLVGHKIKLRSPVYCQSPEICDTCYGSMRKYVTNNIGIIAAQAIGERGSQLIMRTFHVDAVVTTNKAIINEIPGLIATEKGYKLKNKNTITINKADVLSMSDYEINVTKFTLDNHEYKVTCTINLISSLDINYQGDNIFITIDKGAEAIILNKSTALRDQITEVMSLVNMKADKKIKNPVALLRTIHDIYNSLGSVNIIHFEILLSQMLRSANNMTIPYRLDTSVSSEPTLVGIKKSITLTDPKLALLFERVNDAIINGVTQEYSGQLESDLTKYHI